MTEAQWIQLAFPAEPDWETVSDDALIELVEDFQGEPSCAQWAMTELKLRKHPRATGLCEVVLQDRKADRWLRAGAIGHLLSLDPIHGLDTALGWIDTCESELLEEIIEALNYEHQGERAEVVHRHAIVQRVRDRLKGDELDRQDFGPLFLKNFGA